MKIEKFRLIIFKTITNFCAYFHMKKSLYELSFQERPQSTSEKSSHSLCTKCAKKLHRFFCSEKSKSQPKLCSSNARARYCKREPAFQTCRAIRVSAKIRYKCLLDCLILGYKNAKKKTGQTINLFRRLSRMCVFFAQHICFMRRRGTSVFAKT